MPRRTEALRRLAQAQERTEAGLQRLTKRWGARPGTGRPQQGDGLRVGKRSLSRAASFSLRKHDIKIKNHIIRTEIDGVEINFFAQGEQNGSVLYLVGETKLQLDERRANRRLAERVFDQLDQAS